MLSGVFRRTDHASLAAKQRSDAIDRHLQASRASVYHGTTDSAIRGNTVKLLILGPSEAGKSTFVKHLRALHDQDAFGAERESFKLAILLTLLRCVKAVAATFNGPHRTSLRPLLALIDPLRAEVGCVVADGLDVGRSLYSPLGSPRGSNTSICSPKSDMSDALSFTTNTTAVTMGQASCCISDDQEELSYFGFSSRSPVLLNYDEDGSSISDSDTLSDITAYSNMDVKVFPRVWRDSALKKRRSTLKDFHSQPDQTGALLKSFKDPRIIIARYRSLIAQVYNQALLRGLVVHDWQDEQCPDALLELNESSAYVLENVDRIAQPDYTPSADDIMHIRVATVGMEEHVMNVGSMLWRVCDPAGIKGQRKNWLPYFDDAGAVIFVCAISSFNQTLREDNQTNRLADALELFGSIAKNRILAKVDLILFLNKCDILAKKLKRGKIQVSKYFPEFTGNNDPRDVTQYFTERFSACNAFPNRKIFVHPTTAISRSAMRATTRDVVDVIVRSNIRHSGLLC